MVYLSKEIYLLCSEVKLALIPRILTITKKSALCRSTTLDAFSEEFKSSEEVRIRTKDPDPPSN